MRGISFLKLISWNVNGFAILGKGFADIFGLRRGRRLPSETKMQPGQAEFSPPGYHQYWYSAEKKGYSGTAVFTHMEPLSVRYGIGKEEHSHEGRAITLEFEQFFLVNVYTPNSQNELARLPYRMQWEDDLRAYLCALDTEKPVVYCGDLNVAHREIDLKNPKQNIHSAGFSYEERQKMTDPMSGFVDTFRARFVSGRRGHRWSYFRRARGDQRGWRIDYFIVSERLREKIGDAHLQRRVRVRPLPGGAGLGCVTYAYTVRQGAPAPRTRCARIRGLFLDFFSRRRCWASSRASPNGCPFPAPAI